MMVTDRMEQADSEALKDSVDCLPVRYRLPVWLHHVEGFPIGEVAEILSLPEAVVRWYASWGLRIMRKRLNGIGRATPGSGRNISEGEVVLEIAPVTLMSRIDGVVWGSVQELGPDDRRGQERLEGTERLWLWIAFWGALVMLVMSGGIRRVVTDALIRWLGG